MKLIDLTGRAYGKWTVLRRADTYSWWCKCECGFEKSVLGYALRKGKNTKCRECWKKEVREAEDVDLIGRTFGKWTVLSRYLGKDKKKLTFWLCRCECGLEKPVYYSHLKFGKSKSCRECSEHKHKDKLNARILSTIKWGAKARNISYNESSEFKSYIYDLFHNAQNGKCALTGWDITIADFSREQAAGIHTASLDRIDSSKGYEIGNVQWLHKDVNKMKWDLPQEKFIEICIAVTRNNRVGLIQCNHEKPENMDHSVGNQ